MAKKRAAKNNASMFEPPESRPAVHAGRTRKSTPRKKTKVKMKISAGHLAAFRKIFGGKIPASAMEQIRKEYRRNPGAPGEAFKRCVAAVEARGGAASPSGVCATAGRKKYGKKKFARMSAAGKKRAARKNPVEAAADKYREFHGKDPETITEVVEEIHQHSTLSGIGKLVKLVILSIDNRAEVAITNFKGALLAQDEQGLQLFVVGGDQRVNVADFGIKNAHEQEVLGAVKEVWYDTDKTHLRPEDGGKATYHHTFGDKRTRLPLMIYDTRNKLLMFAGGQYDMPEVGIRG